MRTVEERLAVLDEMVSEAAASELILRTADDEPLDGRTLSFGGQRLLNFGSCSYLGLELDPRMRAGVCEAVMRYGTQFSSSRTYVQAPPYLELESLLEDMFGGPVLVMPSTTLGHIAALPVLVGSRDAVIVDQQVHHSVQMSVNHLRAQGTAVEMIRHSDLDELEAAIARRAEHPRVWYLADGVYSMFADIAPLDRLASLLQRHERLHLYIDDSHGVGWSGRHGRGPALEALGNHERLVVAASLNKSFAAAGAAIVFPHAELKRRVRLLGGPMIFSGPVQPPMLGAALTSARIHLSPELPGLQSALRARIEFCLQMLAEFCVPLACADPAPIRFIPIGLPHLARALARRLLDDGFYTNVAHFPAVPMKQAGVRFTLTRHHQAADIHRLVEALARHVPAVLETADRRGKARPGSRAEVVHIPGSSSGALSLEHHPSIDRLDGDEWDRLLGDRGTFSTDGLRFLERAFGTGGRPEDSWSFHYYIVRDAHRRPVLATWFTEALWKDDMLSPAAVSALVEQRRREDPHYLTSRTLAMGSLLTEGDHLYLDRSGAWLSALDLLTEAIGEDAEVAGAETVVLRDIPAVDTELADALHERGFVRVAMPDSYVIEPVAASDSEWLTRLTSRARAHQRREVLAREDLFDIEVLDRSSRIPSEQELDVLHQLYRNVRARSLEINSFELPRTLFRDMLAHDCWELMLLRLRPQTDYDEPTSDPVAFGAHFIGKRHYAPLLVGLDYSYVRSHGSYRQALRQAVIRARVHGANRIMLGMGAPLEKHRVGARSRAHCAYVQSADDYSHGVLIDLQAGLAGATVQSA